MKINSKPNFLRSLTVGFMVFGLVFSPALVFALPSEGEVVSGTAIIDDTSSTIMNINQSTDKLIINWDGFSIGVGESVQFFQPGVNSVALNRVVGQDPSLILGSLSANGQIFVVNPSGVYLGANAQVDAHGFLATTLGISNDDFLNETYNFAQDSVKALSFVINEGLISATSYVGLLAPGVENRGSIVVADLGSVALASGEAAVMDFLGDGLINFVVTDAVSGVVLDENGQVMKDRINNSGLIRAHGGRVLMTAQDAGNVISSVVNHSGIIEAQTVAEQDGEIILAGGDLGVVNVTGLLDASGNDAGETGGLVEITGEQVGLFDFAAVDVSGHAGGGSARIEAEDIYIDQEVGIHADALTLGDGGTVVVLADDVARIYGSLSARGGADGGDGGWVDTSGGNNLEILNAPDVSAPNGAAGEWHIASSRIDIVDGTGRINIFEGIEEDDHDHDGDDNHGHNGNPHGDDHHDGEDNHGHNGHNGGNPHGEDHHDGEDNHGHNDHGDDDDSSVADAFLAFGEGAELGAGLIVAALNDGATVVVSAEGSETSDTILSADLNVTGDNSSSLTLNAYNDVLINADITSDQAPLDLTLQADTDRDGLGDVVIAETSNIFTHDGAIKIRTNDFSLLSPLNSGNAGTTITFLTGDLYLGNLAEGEQGLSNDELDFITADHLILNGMADMFVRGVDLSDGNIDSYVELNSGNNVTFEESASIFSELRVNAGHDIFVDVDVDTLEGDFIAVAGAEFDETEGFPLPQSHGGGQFILAQGATITSNRDIDVTADTVTDIGTFNELRDLIINGVVVTGTGGGGTGGGGTGGGGTEEEFTDPFVTGSPFVTDFIQNSGGC